MIQVRGLYRLPEREDIPVVRFFIRAEGGRYVATIWTDDGRLDKIARAPDMRPGTVEALEAGVNRLATEWLNSECKLSGA